MENTPTAKNWFNNNYYEDEKDKKRIHRKLNVKLKKKEYYDLLKSLNELKRKANATDKEELTEFNDRVYENIFDLFSKEEYINLLNQLILSEEIESNSFLGDNLTVNVLTNILNILSMNNKFELANNIVSNISNHQKVETTKSTNNRYSLYIKKCFLHNKENNINGLLNLFENNNDTESTVKIIEHYLKQDPTKKIRIESLINGYLEKYKSTKKIFSLISMLGDESEFELITKNYHTFIKPIIEKRKLNPDSPNKISEIQSCIGTETESFCMSICVTAFIQTDNFKEAQNIFDYDPILIEDQLEYIALSSLSCFDERKKLINFLLDQNYFSNNKKKRVLYNFFKNEFLSFNKLLKDQYLDYLNKILCFIEDEIKEDYFKEYHLEKMAIQLFKEIISDNAIDEPFKLFVSHLNKFSSGSMDESNYYIPFLPKRVYNYR